MYFGHHYGNHWYCLRVAPGLSIIRFGIVGLAGFVRRSRGGALTATGHFYVVLTHFKLNDAVRQYT